LTVSFNETMIRPNKIEHINSTVLDVKIKPTFDDRTELLGFTWATKSYSGKSLQLQLTFEHPDQVSFDLQGGPDVLSVKVLSPTYFMGETSFMTIKNETTASLKTPRQMAGS